MPIFESLREKGWLYRLEDVTHRYPTCWRCKNELAFRVSEEWYVAVGPKERFDTESVVDLMTTGTSRRLAAESATRPAAGQAGEPARHSSGSSSEH